MNKLIPTLLIMAVSANAGAVCSKPYLALGAGYKIMESDYMMHDGKGVPVDKGHPIAAQIELGCERGIYSYGITHNSQWFDGWPIDSDYEYHNTQLFIRVRFDLGGFD